VGGEDQRPGAGGVVRARRGPGRSTDVRSSLVEGSPCALPDVLEVSQAPEGAQKGADRRGAAVNRRRTRRSITATDVLRSTLHTHQHSLAPCRLWVGAA